MLSKKKRLLLINSILKKKSGGNIFSDIYNTVSDTFSNITDRITGFFSGPRTNAPPQFRQFLEEFGNNKIETAFVCRKPIQSFINTFFNFITFGQFETALKNLNYDELFHLYIVINLDNNRSFRVEKNEVVRVEPTYEGCEDYLSAPIRKPIKVIDFFENGKKQQPDDFFLYDAKTNNCQVFLTSLLNGNNINTPQLNSFVKQDAIAIFSQMPAYAEKIGKFITDLGARADILISGASLHKKRHKRRLLRPKKKMRKPLRRV
jgi:hypothetical protein